MEPGCAGADSLDRPLAWGRIQPCLSTVGAPIWISALQPGPSPAQGIRRDVVPRAGEGANEQRQDNEAGKGFLYFRAQEEILQLVNLDAISVHFSLCNQPICSSSRSDSARPVAGRCLPGTALSVSAMVSPGRLRARLALSRRLLPLPVGLRPEAAPGDQQTGCDCCKQQDQA